MSDVFISYSRRDSAYVSALQAALSERGKDVWVDVEGIRDAEVFPDVLRRAIESSDAFLFVISPDSVASEYCELEIAHAVELNKRIVPVSLHAVADAEVPEEIRFRNWIPAGDGAPEDEGVARITAALEADLAWDRQHTRMTVKALEWEQSARIAASCCVGRIWLRPSSGWHREPARIRGRPSSNSGICWRRGRRARGGCVCWWGRAWRSERCRLRCWCSRSSRGVRRSTPRPAPRPRRSRPRASRSYRSIPSSRCSWRRRACM